MAYDTGCTSLVIFRDELPLLLRPGTQLPVEQAQTAAGFVHAQRLPVELRVLTEDYRLFLRDWHAVRATVINRVGPRLSSKSLNGQFFICERPSDRRLFVAQTKTALYKMI